MAAIKEKPKEEKKVLEDPDVIVEQISKAETFVEHNKNLVFTIVSIILLAVGGFFFYRYYIDNQNNIAQQEMFQAVFYLEADSLNKALNGDGNNYGFEEIIDEYPGTKAANLSKFYAGVAYIKMEEYELAIERLNSFGASDLLIQSRAYLLIGDANMEIENYEEAAASYMKAADYKPNEFFSPKYLFKAAIAYEKGDNLEKGIACYDKIIKDFPKSTTLNDARKHKARLEMLASK